MKKEMYLWNIEFSEHYSFSEKGDYDENGLAYNIVANDAEEAVKKAKKLAIGNKFFDDADEKEYTRTDVQVVSIVRKEQIDG